MVPKWMRQTTADTFLRLWLQGLGAEWQEGHDALAKATTDAERKQAEAMIDMANRHGKIVARYAVGHEHHRRTT